MKKKIGRILHWIYLGGVYVLGLLIMSELNWPDFVYHLWTIVYAVGYIAHDLEHGEWPGDEEEVKMKVKKNVFRCCKNCKYWNGKDILEIERCIKHDHLMWGTADACKGFEFKEEKSK